MPAISVSDDHHRDPLTGIWNRALIPIRLQETIELAQNEGGHFSILMIDLDHFKSVNDAFGHSRGDRVLASFAEFLQNSTRETDTVFRYGGDEFLVLLGDAGRNQALIFADRLLNSLAQTQFQGSPPITLSASAGLVTYPEEATSAEGLFDLADQRHYAAKLAGRGRFVAEDRARSVGLAFDSQSRLIDRDAALQDTHALLDELPPQSNAVLHIQGPEGSGKTRFMQEFAKIGRMRGYMVLSLSGSPALHNREFGALLTAQSKWEGLTLARPDLDSFRESAAIALSAKGQSGVVITVNEHRALDSATRRLLQNIVRHKLPFQCVLAYTANPHDPVWELETEISRSIHIGPFKAEAVRIWVRQVMNWEAPAEFTSWLFQRSEGLPGKLRTIIRTLIDQGDLHRLDQGWHFETDLLEVRLGLIDDLDINALTHAPGNLPADLDLLVGRNTEIDLIRKQMGQTRLLTISGQGGMGKSRLAVQAAAEMQARYSDGAYLVRLGQIREPVEAVDQIEAVANAIAVAWQLPTTSDEAIRKQLIEGLRAKNMLLVLDNFEHLPAAAELLSELHELSPEVHMLVTSREVLHLPEERVIQVDGLDVPAETGQVGLDDNQDPMEFASIRLFLHFAGKLNPEFVPSQADLISISHICRLVGGLPLGIRLAASWMGISPPHQISQQLESNLDILALQRPVQTEQERQFEAVFEYFWNLLSDAERQVLCRLSVFQGPFNRGAASHIAGASPFFLSALVDRSFLQADVEGRFELHETLRQFSGQNLVRYADEPETVRQTHANYFLGLLNQAVSGMRSRHQKRVLADLTSVFENIRTAWYWSLDSGHIVQLGLSAEGLSLFLDLTSRLREGVNFFGDTVTRLEIDSSSTPVETQAFGVLLGRFGKFLSAVGQKPRALKITEQALAIAESSQNDSEIAFGLNLKGWLLTDLGGAHIEAIGLWQKGLAIYRRLALPWGISTMLQNLAYHLPPSKAGALLAERHEIAVEMDDLLGLADSQLLLGSFNLQTGTLSAAKTHVELGIQHFEELRNREGISYALVVLAKIALRAGDLDSARRNIQTSISLDSMIGNLPGLAMSAHTQFLIEFYAGNYRQAYRGFKERLAIAQTEEDSVYIGGSLWGIGISAMALGEMEEATEQLEAALTLFESTQNSWWQARVLSRLVQLHCLQGDHEIAWQRGQTAIGIAEAGGDHLHLAKIHHNLARAALDLSELDKAAESLATALEHSVSLQAWPAGLSILVETAQLFSQLNRNDQALELLNRIADHRLTFKTDRSRAAALLETLGQAKPTADQADPEQSNTVDKWVAVFWDRL